MFNDNANSGFSSSLTLTALSQDTAEKHDDLGTKDGSIDTPEHIGSLVDGVQQVNQDFELDILRQKNLLFGAFTAYVTCQITTCHLDIITTLLQEAVKQKKESVATSEPDFDGGSKVPHDEVMTIRSLYLQIRPLKGIA